MFYHKRLENDVDGDDEESSGEDFEDFEEDEHEELRDEADRRRDAGQGADAEAEHWSE
jgi:hypothetical protein